MSSTSQAFAWLIDTLFNFYLVALLLRILLEALRADYYNPICQLLIKATDPLVKPLGRLIPRAGSINLAAVVVLFALELLLLFILTAIIGKNPGMVALLVLGLRRLARMLLTLYLVLIIASVLLSWLGQNFRHPIVPLIYRLSESVLAPIRRGLPPIAGLDLSPLVALVGINFLLVLLGP